LETPVRENHLLSVFPQFYLKLGFVDTGEWEDEEKILMKDL
jgi:hypothetical protein